MVMQQFSYCFICFMYSVWCLWIHGIRCIYTYFRETRFSITSSCKVNSWLHHVMQWAISHDGLHLYSCHDDLHLYSWYVYYREMWEKLYSEINTPVWSQGLIIICGMFYVYTIIIHIHYLKMELCKQVVLAGLGVVVVVWSVLYSCPPYIALSISICHILSTYSYNIMHTRFCNRLIHKKNNLRYYIYLHTTV